MRKLWIAFAILSLWLAGVGGWIGQGPEESPSDTADVAIVLGAAVDGDEPSPVFRERINHAIALYRQGRVGRIVFTGGRGPSERLAESRVAHDYAIAQGVAEANILTEEQSATTRQNLVQAEAVMQSQDLDTALVVSDPLHLRRAMLMADSLDMDAKASATTTTRYQSVSTQLPFLLREVYFIHHFWLFGE
ncbi:YdcF family protein [Pontixanthobacter aquaemixtae]|uniref:YdcF family protein n=1 Tax=Pontixanthobacter aquaemixtae TaxID=1958940 RepID=A0A844ZRF3_9SPHN|nr:YdcF family protein [Pontixanthobacter aquaemixtae]MXO90104.1 YdcF family protein [Pontixanthobacter aquaemixtae]